MNKLVYLFELDSVRNSRVEAELGQRAMFNEIVNNGNQIALTFNQITDSKAFLSVLMNKTEYEQILNLAKKGTFRFSRYKKAATPAQYVINALNENIEEIEKNNKDTSVEVSKTSSKGFLFSAIPIKKNEDKELKKLRDAIMYSNLTIYDEPPKALAGGSEEDKTTTTTRTFLRHFTELVLTLSMQDIALNYEKEAESKPLIEIIEGFAVLYAEGARDFPESTMISRTLLSSAFDIIKHIIKTDLENPSGEINKRSWWVERLRELFNKNDGLYEGEAILLAEAIIDLCYNYTVEDSIKDVSKHYQAGDNSLENDFEHRILLYWKQSKTLMQPTADDENKEEEFVHKFLKEDSDKIPECEEVELPDWKLAVRLMENMSRDKEFTLNKDGAPKKYKGAVYATDQVVLQNEERHWRNRIHLQLGKKILLAIGLILGYCIVDIVIDVISDYLSTLFAFSANYQTENELISLVVEVINIGVNIVFFGVITSVISTVCKIPDILESIMGIGRSIIDIFYMGRLRNNKKYDSYEGVIESEK